MLPSIIRTIALASIGCLIGLYIGYPPPPLTDEVQTFFRHGTFFWYRPPDGSKALEIFYRDIKGDGPEDKVLLLVHGLPTFSYDWVKILPGLKEHFGRIIAPDTLGAGFSAKPANHNYSIFEYADITEALLANLKIDTIHIMSHDLGITTTQEMLARFNKCHQENDKTGLKIVTLCQLNGAMFPRLFQPLMSQKLLITPIIGDILVRMSNRFYFLRNFDSLFGSPPEPYYSRLAYTMTAYKEGTLAFPRIFLYQNERRQFEHRWVGALHDTHIPVHYIYGPSDTINPPRTFEEYKKRVPRSSVTLMSEKIAHYPQWENPEGVLKAYYNFLKEHGHL